MEVILWNGVLSFITGLLLWLIKSQSEEIKRIQILLNRTREEVAKEYVTKVDVHHDINRVLDRLDRLENKLDSVIGGRRAGEINAQH